MIESITWNSLTWCLRSISQTARVLFVLEVDVMECGLAITTASWASWHGVFPLCSWMASPSTVRENNPSGSPLSAECGAFNPLLFAPHLQVVTALNDDEPSRDGGLVRIAVSRGALREVGTHVLEDDGAVLPQSSVAHGRAIAYRPELPISRPVPKEAWATVHEFLLGVCRSARISKRRE